MLSFPNGKINIGLEVIRKRADGYHDLQSIFYPIAIKDAIEIIPSQSESPIVYTQSGIAVNGKESENLCQKAYHLLKKDFPSIPHVNMHLHKAIPIGAGLGGGSSDASAMLMLLNQYFSLNISNEKLMVYAGELGSDCPFFIINKPYYVTGRGENLSPIELDLSGYQIVLVNPCIHISTQTAFAGIVPREGTNLVEHIQEPVHTWKDHCINDFEQTVFKAYPEIEHIKKDLYQAGAIYASMSGSGSTVYGIFEKTAQPNLNFPPHYFYKSV
jgi:4-diphosphocytidyl-2-C-methyl-D-erythritol kinase